MPKLKRRKQKNNLGFYIQELVNQNFFKKPITSLELIKEIRDEFGKKFKTIHVQGYMQKFLGKELRSIKHPKTNTTYWVSKKSPKDKALLSITGYPSQASERLLSAELRKKMGKKFEQDFDDLEFVFSKSGTCTAFLLRKILEKSIYLVFAKQGLGALIQDPKSKKFVGLEDMIEISTKNKIHGIPILQPKTAQKIQGIKFLGDASAHNPLVNVKIETISLSLAYLITAYEELSNGL